MSYLCSIYIVRIYDNKGGMGWQTPGWVSGSSMKPGAGTGSSEVSATAVGMG